MFALNPIDVGTGGQWNNLQPTLWEAAGAKWRLGRSEDSAMAHYEQAIETFKERPTEMEGVQPAEEKVDPEELNKRYGLPGLEFSIPEYEHIAAMRSERHKALMTDKAIASAAPVFSSWIGAPSFLVGMLGSMTRPLDFGAQLLLPGVGGEISLGRKVAVDEGMKFLSTASRFAPLAERGLIPRTAVPLADQFPRLAPSVMNNLVQQAVLEVPIKIHDIQKEGSPDFEASAVNMVTGAAFAEGLRVAGHYAVKLGSRYVKAAMDRAVGDLHAGRDIDVSQELMAHSIAEEARTRTVREEVDVVAPRTDARATEIVRESVEEGKPSKLSEESKAVVREKVKEEAKALARSEGITIEEATRRAQNKVAGELADHFRTAMTEIQKEGNIGYATPEATIAIAEAVVKSGDPSDIHVRQTNTALALIQQIEDPKARAEKIQNLGESLGIKVRKSSKGLPEGARIVGLPKKEEGLAGIVNAELTKNSEVFTALGDAAVDRANRAKAHLDSIVKERVKSLVEANKDVRVEDGDVITPRDEEVRAEQLRDSEPDPEELAEVDRITTDEDLIEQANREMEKELGELNAEEKAAIESARDFDIESEEKVAKSAADCITKNG